LPQRQWDAYDSTYSAAAVLNKAGVRFAISDNGRDASNARNLPFHAGAAVAFGLPHDVGLRSVTLSAAEILGVADRLGSLDPGKGGDLLPRGRRPARGRSAHGEGRGRGPGVRPRGGAPAPALPPLRESAQADALSRKAARTEGALRRPFSFAPGLGGP